MDEVEEGEEVVREEEVREEEEAEPMPMLRGWWSRPSYPPRAWVWGGPCSPLSGAAPAPPP